MSVLGSGFGTQACSRSFKLAGCNRILVSIVLLVVKVVLRPVSLGINLLRYAHMDNKEDKIVRAKLSVLLKEAREAAGLTQAQVAKLAGVNANYYSVVERGEGNLSYVKIHRIIKVLKIKSLDIL